METTYNKAKQWIYNNTVENDGGIAISDKQVILYPEVTGYYIPTLINIGEIDLAKKFAIRLCEKQKEDGSWYDAKDEKPYIFDTGQILKGLMAIRKYLPSVKENVIKGIEWMLSCVNSEGKFVNPVHYPWADESVASDLILLYTLSPILEASKAFNKPEYESFVNKIIDCYTKHNYDKIVNYSMFSHFYAYVIEALVDCGRTEIAKIAMHNLEKYVRSNGAIYAYNNVKWYCSTAMFQFAIIWYKLGDKKNADNTFNYACSLQNKTGGWYGSYTNTKIGSHMNRLWAKIGLSRNMYMKDEEISWAVKFYFDAKLLKDESDTK